MVEYTTIRSLHLIGKHLPHIPFKGHEVAKTQDITTANRELFKKQVLVVRL
jgi:hypothetical protein